MNDDKTAMALTERLDSVPETGADQDLIEQAAAELRRLYAENAALLAERRNLGAAIERQYSAAEHIADRVMRLESHRDELLDALQSLISDNHPEYIPSKLWKQARAAIAKAEGENQ